MILLISFISCNTGQAENVVLPPLPNEPLHSITVMDLESAAGKTYSPLEYKRAENVVFIIRCWEVLNDPTLDDHHTAYLKLLNDLIITGGFNDNK